MREIKFRAWVKDHREVLGKTIPDQMTETFSFGDFDEDYFIPLGCYLEYMELMQYTGLKDNLGAEVYEGDIVAIYPLEKENYATVEQTSFGWCFKQADGTEITYLSPELFRVIGNIYESPELLTTPKQKES